MLVGQMVYAGWNSIPTSQLCPQAKYQRPRIPRSPTTCSRKQSETVNLGCKCLIFEDAVDCKSLKMVLIARDNIFNSQVHPQMMHQALVSERAASNYWKKETKCSIILHWYINWIKKQMSILWPILGQMFKLQPSPLYQNKNLITSMLSQTKICHPMVEIHNLKHGSSGQVRTLDLKLIICILLNL